MDRALCVHQWVCATIGVVNKGKKIYDKMARQEWPHNDVVKGDALVCMRAKYGAVSKGDNA